MRSSAQRCTNEGWPRRSRGSVSTSSISQPPRRRGCQSDRVPAARSAAHPPAGIVERLNASIACYILCYSPQPRGGKGSGMVIADGGRRVTVAAVQTNPRLGAIGANVDDIEQWIRRAAARGAELIVFPECAVNGYRYATAEEAKADAETVPGPTTGRLARIAAEVGALVAVG
ncbi:MAG: hypothetical protein GEU74_13190, partial [Nitriliruptorales bacterium]|nr:hypothetical protein [Nitriliruptorales bacterium]